MSLTQFQVKAFQTLVSGEDTELKDAYERFHRMVEREQGVVTNATLIGVEQTKKNTESIVAGMSESLALAGRMDNNIQSVLNESGRMNKYLENQETIIERQSIIRWISSLDFHEKQRSVFSKHHRGTGQWLLDSVPFQHWLRSDSSSTLWCSGNPGSGKTVMMSAVVGYLEENIESSDVAIAYVYCDYKDRETLSETNIWASIVRQLVEACRQIPTEVTKFRDKYLKKRSLPTNEERILLIRTLSQLFRKTFILIDALDECPEDNREAFISQAKQLQSSVHLFITSRSNLELTTSLENLSRINLYASSSDIEKYLTAKIDTSRRMRSFLAKDPTMKHDIIQNLLERADGMFLLAHVQIQFLCSCQSLKHVRSSIDSLVGDMETYYGKTLQRIEDQQDDDNHLAIKALSYVFYAKKSLQYEELVHALSVEPGDNDIDQTAFTERHILLSITAGLLQVDEKTDEIRLIHLTLHEYLEKYRSRFLQPELEFSRTCLTYLSFNVFGTGPCVSERDLNDRMRHYAFLLYASHHWGDHFTTNQEPQCIMAILSLLEDEAKLASSLQVLYIPRYRKDGWYECFPERFSPLHAVAYWGLENVFLVLRQVNMEVNSQDSQGVTALHLASRRGFVNLVRLLLENGANTDVINDRGETALTLAARNGHGPVMELLIASGANLLIEDDEGWTALHWAVISRHETLVKLLIEQYAKLRSDNTQTNKALILAAEAGDSKTTEMLLHDGADIDWKDEEGSTALHWSVAEGHEQTSSVLLKNGADANSKDNYENTPLHWAIPYEGITRLLLESGAHPNPANNTKQTPLSWSAQAGLMGTTQELLQKGGNANAQDMYGATALHAAALQGHEILANLLLGNGADANIKDEDGWTPLHAALVRQHVALTQQLVDKTANGEDVLYQMQSQMEDENERALLEEMAARKSLGSTVVSGLRSAVNSGYRERIIALLDSGADIDAEDQIGDSTALTLAAWLGRDSVVELLLEHGADPNRRERHGRTALHIAAMDGYPDIVATLVEYGADVDARVHGWTPMLLAAKAWRFGIPDYLIKRGADVNAADYHGRRALHWAAQHGGKTLARLLLQKGASVEAQDRWGKTAFQWAVASGHQAIADMLREAGNH